MPFTRSERAKSCLYRDENQFMQIAAIGLSRGIALAPHRSRHIPSRLASWLVLGRTQSVAKECRPADQAGKERVRCQGEIFRATSQAHRSLFTHSEVCHQHFKSLLLVKASCLYRTISKFRLQSNLGMTQSRQRGLSSWQPDGHDPQAPLSRDTAP